MDRLLGRIERYRRLAVGALVALALVALAAAGYTSGGSASAAYYYYNGGSPVVLTLSPATATNPVGTNHTVTATVTQDGNPLNGIFVQFTVTGSVTTAGSCATDVNGQCTFTYTGPTFPGTDQISAYADTNNNGVHDSDEPIATATKTWVTPASTPGSATGSGTILIGTDVVTFDFSAKSSGTVFQGSCTVTDHATKRKITCRDVTSFVESGNEATFYGHGLDNGAATYYKIRVADNGQSGAGKDTFSISTASGYSASGTLTSGNIQVH